MVIELDESTVKNIKALIEKKEGLEKMIEAADHMIQAILSTVINVKGLTGQWQLDDDFNLVQPDTAEEQQ